MRYLEKEATILTSTDRRFRCPLAKQTCRRTFTDQHVLPIAVEFHDAATGTQLGFAIFQHNSGASLSTVFVATWMNLQTKMSETMSELKNSNTSCHYRIVGNRLR